MATSPEILAARKLNQAKYALEDFDDGVKDLNKAALFFGALALMMAFSLIFDANNVGHLAFTSFGAVVLPFASRFDYLRQSSLFGLTAGYAGLLLLEAVRFGWPDLLLPFLNLSDYNGFPVMMNHLTPFIYWGGKIAFGFFILQLYWLRRRVYAQPEALLRKAAGDRMV